jgi:shikimate kinase
MGLGFVDTDQEIERKTGKSVDKLFANEGEMSFRQLERDVIAFLSDIKSHVIVVGAGAIEDEQNWKTLQDLGVLVWVYSPSQEIAGRLLRRPEELAKRPLLAEVLSFNDPQQRMQALRQKLDELMQKRQMRYETAAHTVVTSYSTAETCARQLKNTLCQKTVSS